MPKGKYGKRETVFRKLIQRIKDSWNWNTDKFDSDDGKKAYNELCNMLIEPAKERITALLDAGVIVEEQANEFLQDFFIDLVKVALEYDPRQKKYYDLGFENFARNCNIQQIFPEPFDILPNSDRHETSEVKSSYCNIMSTCISSVPIEDMRVIYNNDSYLIDFIGVKEEIQKRKKEYLKERIFKLNPLNGLVILLYFGIDFDAKIEDTIYKYFAACWDYPYDVLDSRGQIVFKALLFNLKFYKRSNTGPMSIDDIAELGNTSNRMIARRLRKGLYDLGMLVKRKEVNKIEANE